MNEIGKFEQLATVAKLLNTNPKVLMDFFVDVGLKVLSQTELTLLKSFQSELNNFINEIESEKNQIDSPEK